MDCLIYLWYFFNLPQRRGKLKQIKCQLRTQIIKNWATTLKNNLHHNKPYVLKYNTLKFLLHSAYN